MCSFGVFLWKRLVGVLLFRFVFRHGFRRVWRGRRSLFTRNGGAPWVADVTLVYRRHGESILRISQTYREAPVQALRVTPHGGQLEQDTQNVAYALLE